MSTNLTLLWIVRDSERVLFVSLNQALATQIAKRAEKCHTGVLIDSKAVDLDKVEENSIVEDLLDEIPDFRLC